MLGGRELASETRSPLFDDLLLVGRIRDELFTMRAVAWFFGDGAGLWVRGQSR
jgi:hypothetical protein